MRFGPIEIVLLCLGTIVLTLLILWVREEILDWRSARRQREEERRFRARRRHGQPVSGPPRAPAARRP